jgi:hypothetical protein
VAGGGALINSQGHHNRQSGSMVLKGRLTNSYVHMPKQESATGGPKNNKYPSMGSTGKLSHSSSKVNTKNNMLLKNSSSSQ